MHDGYKVIKDGGFDWLHELVKDGLANCLVDRLIGGAVHLCHRYWRGQPRSPGCWSIGRSMSIREPEVV